MKENKYAPCQGFPQVSTKETAPSSPVLQIKEQERRGKAEWLEFQPPADSNESCLSSLQRSSCGDPEAQLCRLREVVKDLELALELGFDNEGT